MSVNHIRDVAQSRLIFRSFETSELGGLYRWLDKDPVDIFERQVDFIKAAVIGK